MIIKPKLIKCILVVCLMDVERDIFYILGKFTESTYQILDNIQICLYVQG